MIIFRETKMLAIETHIERLFQLAVAFLLAFSFSAQATMVRVDTVLGPIDIELFDAGAPLTVANFLNYVNAGAYSSSFIHRSIPGFVIQGGGYSWVTATSSVAAIPAGPPVVNEFSPTRPNVRGTVAMAKLPEQPNSATTGWFINLANNSDLDTQNGGFTVFGRVTPVSMPTVDAIAALQRVNAGSPFNTLPVISRPASGPLLQEHLVMVRTISVFAPISQLSESDRLFNFLEAAFPQFLAPANASSATALGYYFRYYPGTNAYIGTANGMVYYLVPAISPEVTYMGTLAEWLAIAASAGY
jgi:cyclophilin family peptidyl-prolyl cis-trans isomerase